MFFFGYYEGFRQTTQASQNLTIPANADFNGVFRYAGSTDGVVRSVNVMELSGQVVDPTLRQNFFALIPGAANVNNFDVGDSSTSRNLNTAGYRFNQTDKNDRNQWGFKIDYAMSDRNRFEGGYHYFKEIDDRTDLDAISPDRPLVYTNSDPKRFSLAWRYLASANFQNELRGGANLAPVQFASDWVYTGNQYTTALGIINPFDAQLIVNTKNDHTTASVCECDNLLRNLFSVRKFDLELKKSVFSAADQTQQFSARGLRSRGGEDVFLKGTFGDGLMPLVAAKSSASHLCNDGALNPPGRS